METIETVQHFSRIALQTLINSPYVTEDVKEKLRGIQRACKKRGGDISIGSIPMIYKMPNSNAANLGYGRLQSSKYSIDRLDSEFRDTLLKELYYDIDMVNAQPTLCLQIMRKLGIEAPNLELYVENRESTLKHIMENCGLTRDEAKNKMISLLYGQKCDQPILEPYSKEARTISKELLKRDEYANLFRILDVSKSSIYGSLLSYITQTAERQCLLAMISFFKSKGWSPDILSYDGLYLRKRNDADMTEYLLNEASDFVKLRTGYEIKLVQKPMVGFDLPKETSDGPSEQVTKEQYEAMKLKFESVAGMFEETGRLFYVRDDSKIIWMEKTMACDTLNPLFNFPGKNRWKSIPFLPLWLQDSTRRCIRNITYDADTEIPFSFILPFKPVWKSVEEPEDSNIYVNMFKSLLDVLCPEKQLKDTLIQWLAQMIQKPFQNPLCAVILAGMKGCGKDTLGDFISNYLIGNQFTTNYTSSEQFWDRYDTGRYNKIFAKLEEASGTLNKTNEAGLKSRITSITDRFNPKGCPAFDAPNYCRIFMTTNESNPVSMDRNERRFLLIHCSNAKVGKIDEFWKPLRKLLFTKEGGAAIGNWLSRIDCGSWPRILPLGSLALSMIEDSKSPLHRFIELDTRWPNEWLTAGELYDIYKSWCDEMTFISCKSSIGLGRQLNCLVIDGLLQKRTYRGISQYSKLVSP